MSVFIGKDTRLMAAIDTNTNSGACTLEKHFHLA